MSLITRSGNSFLPVIPLVRSIAGASKQTYATILTPRKTIDNIDLSKQKILSLDPNFTHDAMPTQMGWEKKPTKITVIQGDFIQNFAKSLGPQQNCYVGGIPALMQAVRTLEELGPNSTTKVVFVNDGLLPKSVQSGGQGHEHNTEHGSKACSLPNLFKTFGRGMGVLKKLDPADLNNYSYLHFPITVSDLKNPLKFASVYGSFFTQRIHHSLFSKNGVSENDRLLCAGVKASLDFHETLSHKIVASGGKPTFARMGRVYCSSDIEGMQEKARLWSELDIANHFMTEEDIKRQTLLKTDQGLKVLMVEKDGRFQPDAIPQIVDYLKKTYPNFSHLEADLTEVHVDNAKKPHLVKLNMEKIGEERYLPVNDFFCSPGHNQVFERDPITDKEKQMWKEVGVSGVSTLWEVLLERAEIEERAGRRLDDEGLKAVLDGLLAAANLTNLHTTPIESKIDGPTITLLVRATQGANFGRDVADKDDLENMMHNIIKNYIGKWTLKSVGTCTRKTGPENMPKLQSNMFFHGPSGVGLSYSAAPKSMMRQNQN